MCEWALREYADDARVVSEASLVPRAKESYSWSKKLGSAKPPVLVEPTPPTSTTIE